jgi:hypothetical protein
MALIIKKEQVKKHGLEVWIITVNGTYVTEFLSEAQAQSKIKQMIHAWNVEKVYKKGA